MQKTKKPWFMVDPLEIAILLTLVVLALASLGTESSLGDNINFWGTGLWNLLPFMTQMSLILVGGFMVAVSRPVNRLLGQIATLPKTDLQAYLSCLFVSAFACWCNWGLGLVTGAFFSIEICRKNPKLSFPLAVAISYMGFIFWHGGLSGSIPLTVNTPGNFSEQWIGGTIPLEKSIFSFFNLSLIFALLVSLSLLILYFSKNAPTSAMPNHLKNVDGNEASESESKFSQVMLWALKLLICFFIVFKSFRGQFKLGLNEVNLILILLALALHHSLSSFMKAAGRACGKLAPILIQYPLYAGIMAIMIQSGLAVQISDTFVRLSSETTYSVYMFLSAGLVNFFVPSGGGQWAVQASVVIEGAKQLSLPLERVVMAVAWGDAWTNLAQPFWALPLLAIADLGIKDIMGYCLSALLVSGSVMSFWFLIF